MEGITTVNFNKEEWSLKNLKGYYWLSDSKNPEIFAENTKIDFVEICSSENCKFLIEGMFYDEERNQSLTYKTIDIKEYCYLIDWNIVSELDYEQEKIPFVRNPEGRNLLFRNIFRDEFFGDTAEFSSREFVCRAFVGFESSKIKK